jgi:hypothetical protein
MLGSAFVVCVALGLSAQPPDSDHPDKARADTFRADPDWKALGPSLWFDAKGRRLLVRAKVVLREGELEHLLCLEKTKEHEAILATPAVPRQIHAGLLLTGAEVGHPVRFLPKFEPPAGTPIAITLQWEQDGKARTADARDWVLDARTKKTLATDWVFAGSEIVSDPVTRQTYYLADGGDLITVANFGSAILDLPFASSANNADRTFVARTEVLPPRGTWVTMILRPRQPTPPPAH